MRKTMRLDAFALAAQNAAAVAKVLIDNGVESRRKTRRLDAFALRRKRGGGCESAD